MFKFFLSRYKTVRKRKRFVFPALNVADIAPVLSSYLTNCCPRSGKFITHEVVKLFFGNHLFLRWSYRRQNRTISRSADSGPVLVVADLNIGDAINLQVACQTLKQLFPEREIHYVINENAYSLIASNIDINRVFPVFSGNAIPTHGDIERLKKTAKESAYSLIFNFCPFFETKTFDHKTRQVLNHYPLSMGIAYDELRTQNVNHLRKKIFDYLIKLFPGEADNHHVQLNDVPVFINDDALNTAKDFMEKNGLNGKKGIVLFNPDASSPYTRLPLTKQIELVQKLLEGGVEHLLISSGFNFKGAEKDILKEIDKSNVKKCIIVPNHFSLSTYAALVDYCDVYITNDTGPMHLAASRKKDKQGNLLRNKTAIFSIFGATPARVYGYDSENPLFFPAPQDAPSNVFVSKSICRNVTCINKLSKRCKKIRCFDGLNPQEMAENIIAYLKQDTWN